MSDLVDFLQARLAEDEQVALAATQGRWFWADPDTSPFPQSDRSLMADQGGWKACEYFCTWSGVANLYRGEAGKPGHEHRVAQTVVSGWGYDSSGLDVDDGDAAHIVRHDPVRILADVASKRALIKAMVGPALSTPVARTHDAGIATARYLALPYASHPDYLPEWRPDDSDGDR